MSPSAQTQTDAYAAPQRMKKARLTPSFFAYCAPGFPPPGPVPHFHVKNLSLRGRNAPVAIRNPCEDAFPTHRMEANNPGRTESSAPTNRSVGAGGCPPSRQPIPGHCCGRQSGHFLETGSLHLPLAALRRFPRRPAFTSCHVIRRAGCPHPAARTMGNSVAVFRRFLTKRLVKGRALCYTLLEKQKCGSSRVRQHPRACAGVYTTYTTAKWPHRMEYYTPYQPFL